MAEIDTPILERLLVPQAIQGPFGLLASPFQFLVTGEDHLEVSSFNAASGVTVGIAFRFLEARAQRPIATERRHTPTTDRTRAVSLIPLAEGALLNLRVVAATGAPLHGQTFVIVRVVRGLADSRIALGTLVQGHVTAQQDLAWPGSPIESSLAGRGVVRRISGTNPAAGAEIAETVPTGARWQLLSLRAILTTSATVLDRRPRLELDDGLLRFMMIPAPGNQQASEENEYGWTAGAWQDTVFDDTYKVAGLPTETMLLAGSRIRTDTFQLQAGDNYAAPEYQVREWLEAA